MHYKGKILTGKINWEIGWKQLITKPWGMEEKKIKLYTICALKRTNTPVTNTWTPTLSIARRRCHHIHHSIHHRIIKKRAWEVNVLAIPGPNSSPSPPLFPFFHIFPPFHTFSTFPTFETRLCKRVTIIAEEEQWLRKKTSEKFSPEIRVGKNTIQCW